MEGPGHLGGERESVCRVWSPPFSPGLHAGLLSWVLKAEDIGGARGQGSHSEACPPVVNTTKGTPRTNLPWVPGENDPLTLE